MMATTLPWAGPLPHQEDVDLATLTTMATPGVARLVVTPPDATSLGTLLRDLSRARVPFIVLGGGSNVVFTKTEVKPVIIRLGKGFDFVRLAGDGLDPVRLCAGAGASLVSVLTFARRHRLAGLEWAVGIPGQVGGATVGNAGAGGLGMGDHVVRVRGFTRAGEPVDLGSGEIRFDYRNSNLRHLVLTEVELVLRHGTDAGIVAAMNEFRTRRKGQPYGDHSSGCIFRNPPGGHAGKLIDEAGLKGFAVGQARVSPAHANFLVNDDQAQPGDVLALIEHIRRTVRERTGVELETEVILLDPDRVEPAP